jgi:hypothetical protein
MKVVVPFVLPGPTKIQPWALAATQLALRQDGIAAEFHHMTEDESYYRLLASMWAAGETFATVEHDIVCWPGALQQLENCPEQWCTLPYYCSVGWIKDGLGCTKFSEQLIRRYPDFLKEPFPNCCQHTRFYCGLDRLIAHRAQELGLEPHVHAPGVTNLNDKWT